MNSLNILSPPTPLYCDNCGELAKITGPSERIDYNGTPKPEDVVVYRHLDGFIHCKLWEWPEGTYRGADRCQVGGETFYSPPQTIPVMRQRATYLLQSDLAELNAWGIRVRYMFHYKMPYLVGSVLTSPDWRDVDIRIMLDDDVYDRLTTLISPHMLNLAISTWGQKVTGLPIDFQIQKVTEANEEFEGRRHPIGMS